MTKSIVIKGARVHNLKNVDIEIDMKIVADIDVPFLTGVFEPYAEVVYKKGLEICREDIIAWTRAVPSGAQIGTRIPII